MSGLIAGAIAPASAVGPESPGEPHIFFPGVPNNGTVAGIEGITGSITVQSVEIYPVDVTVTDAAGNELTSITLNPRASQTWTADQLGIAEPGSGVVATAQWGTLDPEKLETAQICELVDEVEAERGSPKDTGDALSSHAANYADMVKVVQNGFAYAEGTDYLWNAIEDTLYVDWGPQGAEPAAGAEYTVYVYECVEPRIAGVEKHTVGTAGARTSSATEMVDGYTAVPQEDVWMASGGGAFLDG